MMVIDGCRYLFSGNYIQKSKTESEEIYHNFNHVSKLSHIYILMFVEKAYWQSSGTKVLLKRKTFRSWNLWKQVHSFIPAISIAPIKVLNYPEAPRIQHGYCIGVSGRSA